MEHVKNVKAKHGGMALKEVLKLVSDINPDAYVTTEPTNPTKLTSNRK